MARALYDGLVEYEDGTPATTSQMAKDVVEFLNWAAEPEMDQRKKMGLATVTVTSVLLALSIWVKRCVISSLRPYDVFADLMCCADINGLQSRLERLCTILRLAGIRDHADIRLDRFKALLLCESSIRRLYNGRVYIL